MIVIPSDDEEDNQDRGAVELPLSEARAVASGTVRRLAVVEQLWEAREAM